MNKSIIGLSAVAALLVSCTDETYSSLYEKCQKAEARDIEKMLRAQTKDVLHELHIWGYFGILWKCSIADTKTHDSLQKYREALSQTEQGKLFFRLHDQEAEVK